MGADLVWRVTRGVNPRRVSGKYRCVEGLVPRCVEGRNEPDTAREMGRKNRVSVRVLWESRTGIFRVTVNAPWRGPFMPCSGRLEGDGRTQKKPCIHLPDAGLFKISRRRGFVSLVEREIAR